MTKKKSTVGKTTTTSLATMPEAKLAPLLGSDLAVSKLLGDGGAVVHEQGVTLVTGRAYAAGDRVIAASQIFFADDMKAKGEGPWLGEADKLSWRDEETGLECIMMRATGRGHLCGYVGVPTGHELWGWDHAAIPADLGIRVHGGLNFSEICQDGPSPTTRLIMEVRRICHVPRIPYEYEAVHHATDHRIEDAHAWWFGFSCDQIYDVVPGDRRQGERFMAAETGMEYRDDAYVVREILNLARQLRAIGAGVPVPAREGPPLPALGLDPRKGG